MSTPPVLTAIADGIGTITLNRPEARNALSKDMRPALAAAVTQMRDDPQVYADAVAEHPGRVQAVLIRRLTPAEQVLAHGMPLPMRPPEADDAPRVVHGADGHELALRLVDAGMLPPQPA